VGQYSRKEREGDNHMRIIVIDDELNLRRTIVPVLKGMGHEVSAAGNSRSALQEFERETFDVALLDLRLGEENGLDLMGKLLKAQPRVAIIVTTAFATIETAVEAMRQGAFDYLAKPFTPEQLQQALVKVARTRQLENKVAELESRVSAEAPSPILESVEPVMQKVYDNDSRFGRKRHGQECAGASNPPEKRAGRAQLRYSELSEPFS
jgi:NtrC-family two-component system response regulator AlgB